MSKILVAYFSAGGTTEKAAERLAAAAGADLFAIQPAVPYTAADLDWTNPQSRSSIERNHPDCRPEIAEPLPDMAAYDTVFVGFPIWWYTAPSIVHTFLESYDFAGKTLIPFATSGGSGMGKTTAALKASCPKARWKDGKLLNHLSDTELEQWIKTM